MCLNTLKTFFPESDLLKWGCVLYARASYMPSNTVYRHADFFLECQSSYFNVGMNPLSSSIHMFMEIEIKNVVIG